MLGVARRGQVEVVAGLRHQPLDRLGVARRLGARHELTVTTGSHDLGYAAGRARDHRDTEGVDCSLFVPAARASRTGTLSSAAASSSRTRVAMALEAFRRVDARLVVAGAGPALAELRAAPPNVEFVGHLEDQDLVALIQRCVALLFPSRDDFGLMPLEAMACGRPVLAFDGVAPAIRSCPR